MKLQTKDPYLKSLTGELDFDSWSTCQEKVLNLQKSQTGWKKKPLRERIDLVQKALSYFEENREVIAKDISEQMGRPQHQSLGEVKGLLERGHHMCSIAEAALKPDEYTDKEGFLRKIVHEPYGVIFVISAWNYPLLITINSVVPALIAGNTILLKHSNLTPKLGEHFIKAFKNLDDTTPLIEQVITDHETTGKIIEEGLVQQVIFTGSVAGGRQILSHCNKQFITPLLELGGKDAAYVDESADLAYAIDSVVDGALFNCGQSCCGIERAYVHEKVYDQFLEGALKIFAGTRLGNPKDPNTSMGPVAKSSGLADMHEQITEATEKGAKVLFGGSIQKIEQGDFFQPTLLKDANNSMQVMREENFGPILPVCKVSSVDEAIQLINDSDYGLTAAIFTNKLEQAEHFAEEVQAGTIFMNRCDYLDPALPWTGYKNSGSGGSSLSKYGFYGVTRRKSKHFKVKL